MKKHDRAVTAEYVRSRLLYDPETGAFFWKPLPADRPAHIFWNPRWAGKPVTGDVDEDGVRIVLDRKKYRAARLAWLISYGSWPAVVVDHINGDVTDNRLANLREATIAQNTHNEKTFRNNKSGFKGVGLHRKSGLWRARIAVDGHRRLLGYFTTKEAAADAYWRAAQELHGEFARAA